MMKRIKKVGNGRVIVLLLLIVVLLGFKIGWFWAGLMFAGLLLAFQDGYDAGVEAGRSETTEDNIAQAPRRRTPGHSPAGTG